jgi:four helix bundle protein
MARIERFEDVKAWQEARVLVKEIYVVTGAGEFARDFGLKDQLRRSAVSVLSNIAEGFERGSDKEFVRFLYIAKGSCGEVRAQLYVVTDVGYLPEPESQRLITQCQRISRLISGLITYLQKPT